MKVFLHDRRIASNPVKPGHPWIHMLPVPSRATRETREEKERVKLMALADQVIESETSGKPEPVYDIEKLRALGGLYLRRALLSHDED